MRIALLTGANPRVCSRGPIVRLQPGTWRLEMVGVVDSKLSVHLEGFDPWWIDKSHNTEFTMHGRHDIQLFFEERGTESHISIFARKVA